MEWLMAMCGVAKNINYTRECSLIEHKMAFGMQFLSAIKCACINAIEQTRDKY